MIKEFREFIARGNVLDLAVGIIIGAAFTAIVNSLVADVITPVIGLVTGGVDFSNIFIVLREGVPAGPYQTLMAAQEAGAVTINVGQFLNAVINFVIVAFVVFLIIKQANRFMPKPPPPPPAGPTTEEKLVQAIDKLNGYLEKKG